MLRTYHPKASERRERWYLVDARGKTLGRLASRVASTLLGKTRPDFTPGVDLGDHVVVVNAAEVAVTGRKLDQKVYSRHSGYPGGYREVTLRTQLARFPDRVIRDAVWGMLPHNRYGRQVLRKLKVYAGPEHPHAGQRPQPLA